MSSAYDYFVEQADRNHEGIQEVVSVGPSAQDAQVQVDLGWGKEARFFAYWTGVVAHSR
jgi:hypothetical protein